MVIYEKHILFQAIQDCFRRKEFEIHYLPHYQSPHSLRIYATHQRDVSFPRTHLILFDVLQGSHLGVFLKLINKSHHSGLHCKILMFANDLKIYKEMTSKEDGIIIRWRLNVFTRCEYRVVMGMYEMESNISLVAQAILLSSTS